MKTKKLSLIAAFVCISGLVAGQDFAFKVMANKGSNEVKSGDTWQPLKTGASLKSGDELKIAPNAYLGLIHASGKPVEIREAGTVKVADIKVAEGSTALNKYTDFILSSNAETKKNKLGATGAVVRDVKDEMPIALILPGKEYAAVYNNVAVINWDGGQAKGPYILTVKDMYEDVIAKYETPEVSYKLDLTNPKFAVEDAIFIEVISKANPKQTSARHYIKRMSAAEREKITKLRDETIGDVADTEGTALGKIFLARFYEENGLLIDAIGEFEAAVKLAPDVPSFKEYYDDFLYRRGMKK